ncbi:TlpA family protein disulfide reductase [Aliikangiella sp. IMCC44653]
MFFNLIRATLLSVLVILSGCQMSLFKQSSVNASSTPKYEEYLQSGEILPIQSVTTIEGDVIDLTNPKRKKLVILFATWCSDSNRALKALNTSLLLTRKDIDIVAIAREESRETVLDWRDKNNIKVSLAADENRAIFSQFAAAGIPRFITVDENNRVIEMNLAEGEEQLSKIVWSN